MNKQQLISACPEIINKDSFTEVEDDLKASAVLLILHEIDNQWNLLLTTRAAHLKHHGGQVSFPGGRYETKDQNLIQTALRETEEEIGINQNLPLVFSQLNEHPTLTGYRMYPFVAVVDSLPKLIVDSGEVENVFSVPLKFLFDKNNQTTEDFSYNQQHYDLYTILWEDKKIWGATARIIVNLSDYLANHLTN